MTKLKCWKKVKQVKYGAEFENKKTKQRVSVGRNIDTKKYNVYKAIGRGLADLNKKEIRTKQKALKFAQSYMKKHDIC